MLLALGNNKIQDNGEATHLSAHVGVCNRGVCNPDNFLMTLTGQ